MDLLFRTPALIDKDTTYLAEQYSPDYLAAHLRYLQRKIDLLRRRRVLDDEVQNRVHRAESARQQRLRITSTSASDQITLKYSVSNEVRAAEREYHLLSLVLREEGLQSWKWRNCVNAQDTGEAFESLERDFKKKSLELELKIEEREQEIHEMEQLLAKLQRRNSRMQGERDAMSRQLDTLSDVLEENKKIKRELMQLKRAEEKRIEREEKEQLEKERREKREQKRIEKEQRERERQKKREKREEEEERRKREDLVRKKTVEERRNPSKNKRKSGVLKEEENENPKQKTVRGRARKKLKSNVDNNDENDGAELSSKTKTSKRVANRKKESGRAIVGNLGPESCLISDIDERNNLQLYTKNLEDRVSAMLKAKAVKEAGKEMRGKRRLHLPQTDMDGKLESHEEDKQSQADKKERSSGRLMISLAGSPSIRGEQIVETIRAMRDTAKRPSTARDRLMFLARRMGVSE